MLRIKKYKLLILLIAYGTISSSGISQSVLDSFYPDSTQDKDLLVIRGVFINVEQNLDDFNILERVPQVRMIEEFVRAHSQDKVMLIWIHPQKPEYANGLPVARIKKLMLYLNSREVPLYGFDYVVVRSKEDELFQKYGSPDIPTVILVANHLKW
jgi:hypothetical protein